MLFAQLLVDELKNRREFNKLIGMPIGKFSREILNVDLWSRQEEFNDLVSEGHKRIHCKAGHGVGKTMDSAVIAMWLLATVRPAPVVITTAPTYRQVKDQLWKEIRYRWNGSPELRRMGEARGTRIDISDFHYAHGFSTNQPERFQGIHNPSIFIIVDEANGFPDDIYESIRSCIVNKKAQIIAIGNAVLPYGWFYNGFEDDKVASMSISSREHPNVVQDREIIPGAVTREWISEFEHEFRHSPQIVSSRIDAEFPSHSKNSLIHRDWVRSAYQQASGMTWPNVLSCDIARSGDNLCVASQLVGSMLKHQTEWGQATIPESAREIERIHLAFKSDIIVVDDDGVGGGVTDMLRERGFPVVAFRGGQKAVDSDKFFNRISEAWWRARLLFENSAARLSDCQSPILETQLCSREWLFDNKRIRVEPKDQYSKRTGFPSPDHADSYVMGIWQLFNEWREGSLKAA